MHAYIKLRQYVIFITPQNFDTADIKCLRVLNVFPVCIMGEMWNLIYQLLVYISIIVVLIRVLKKFI